MFVTAGVVHGMRVIAPLAVRNEGDVGLCWLQGWLGRWVILRPLAVLAIYYCWWYMYFKCTHHMH